MTLKKFSRYISCSIVISYIAFLPTNSIENNNFLDKTTIIIEKNDKVLNPISDKENNNEGIRVEQSVIFKQPELLEKLPIPDINSPVVVNPL